jgi:hypothetical protein
MKWLTLMALALLLGACGGAPRSSLAQLNVDDDLASLPEPNLPALQYYLVLTADASALQGKPALDAMWQAVGGQGARYKAVRQHVRWLPGDYKLDVATDFADLPHPQVSLDQLLTMTSDERLRTQMRSAKLAVYLRSDAHVLPQGNHIRLAGLAALYTADRWQGVIVDLIARRVWAADAWQAELASAALSAQQGRLSRRADTNGTTWLYTRGNPKYGRADLQMRGIKPGSLGPAQLRFKAAQAALLAHGGAVGSTLQTSQGRLRLLACAAPQRFHDAGCVQITAP